ncbi:MAG: alpha/beta hydrolase [Pseudomonadota bacterium]
MMKRLLATFLTFATTALSHATPSVMPLWPEGVPGMQQIGAEQVEAGRISNVSEPTLTMVGPAAGKSNGTAIIILPGGGYSRLSFDHEGIQYANFLSSLGVTTFVLKYRLRQFGHPAPLQDVLRAVRLVRARAAELGVNPARIGVMGSSAGGHLAASAGTLFDHAAGKTGATLDAISARPDFLMLLYPVITLDGPAAHAGSRGALLGPNPTPELIKLMSLEGQVSAATPPTFLMHTQADKTVPVENSILFYQALTRHGVPAEMVLYEVGGHGAGMRPGNGTTSEWPRRAEEWLRERKLLNQSPAPSISPD